MDEVTLTGTRVSLVPLRREHVDALAEVGLDPELWRVIPTPVTTRDDMARYVDSALAAQADGSMLPFAIVERATDRVIGSTRYFRGDTAQPRVEIGWTWLGRAWWRTGYNVECKLLLLEHAFERMGCIRVELKTDALNTRSRNAILALGATEEGTFRSHMVVQGGRRRDTVYFSILDSEWPAVRARLEARLAAAREAR